MVIENTPSRRIISYSLTFILLFLLIPLASADLFVKKTYESDTTTITLDKAFLGVKLPEWLGGGSIANATLNTPKIYYASIGTDKLVAEFTINSHKDFANTISKMEFFNINDNMKPVEKEFTYKVKGTATAERDTYGVIGLSKNGSEIYGVTGKEQYEYITWTPLAKIDLKQDERITIGIFTDVKLGDYVEWIPTMYGVRVDEWAIYSADPALISYYKFDETSGTNVYDSTGTVNGTASSASIWTSSGKINYGLFPNSAYNVQFGTDLNSYFNSNNDFSISLWASWTHTGYDYFFWNGGTNEPYTGIDMFTDGAVGADKVVFRLTKNNAGGDSTTVTSTQIATLNNGSYHHIVVTHEKNLSGNWLKIYIDGNFDTVSTDGTVGTDVVSNSTFTIGSRTTDYFPGYIDEVGIWNRTLSGSEVLELYNSGVGLQYPFSNILVTLTNPTNNSAFTSSTGQTFNATATMNSGTSLNATRYLYTNAGVLISTNFTTYVPNNKTNFTIPTLSDGTYKWNIQMCGSNSLCVFGASNRTYIVDSTLPIPIIVYPQNITYNSNVSNLNYTVTDSSPGFAFYSRDSGVTNSSILAVGTNFTNVLSVQGNNIWTLYVNDTVGNSNYTNVTFFLDSIQPSIDYGARTETNNSNLSRTNIVVNVTASDTDLVNITLFLYNTSGLVKNVTTITSPNYFNFTGLADGRYYFNASAIDIVSGANYTSTRQVTIDTTDPVINFTSYNNLTITATLPQNASFVINQTDTNPGFCWTEFGGINTTRTCGQNFNITFPTFGNFTVRGWVNDSSGSQVFLDRSVLIVHYNTTQSVTTVAEGGASTFTLIVNGTPLLPTIATLRYNNSNFAPTTQTTSTNGTLYAYTLVLPVGWGNSTGRTQFWNWTFTLAGTNTTTATQSQTVLSITPSNCSAGGDLVYNFTHYDEEDRSLFNFSTGNNLQIDLTITSTIDSSISVQYNTTVINAPSILVCVPTGALSGNTYRVDATGSYSGTDFVQEFYYIDNGTISGTNIPQNIAWYDLLLADSTTFLFTFLDENGIEVPNIIVHTLRYYIGEAQFIEVERSKTDNNGETHLHLIEEDVIYKFNITEDGVPIFLSAQYNAKCLSTPCSITLSAQPENDPFPTVYNNLPQGSYRIEADQSTRQVTLYFNLNETATMNLTVWTSNNNLAEPVVSGTTTASAGTVVVTVPLQYGNASYTGVIYMGNQFVASRVVDLSEDAKDYFGSLGLLLGALAVLCLALIGASHGEWVIVWTVLGLIVVSVLFLVDLPWYALMAFIAGSGVFLNKLVSRRRIP